MIHGMSDTLGNDHPDSTRSARDRFVHDSTFARSGHAEHVIDLLVRRGRLADSDSHPIELVRPDGGNYRLKTFVPTGAPLPAYTYGADGQVYVVCNDDQPFRIGPIPGQQVLRRFAAQVYIRTRQGQDRGVAGDVDCPARTSRLFSRTAPVSSASRLTHQ